MNMQDFYNGKAFNAYEYFGAHIEKNAVRFRTYAPGAAGVCLIGEWNGWQEEDMKKLGNSGVYELLSPDAAEGMLYKYKIYNSKGANVDHCDPYGFAMELRPGSASKIVDLGKYKFSDSRWLAKRSKNHDLPMNIYELHLASWRTKAGKEKEESWFSYEEIADELIDYLKSNNYSHVEFMPLSEHPADESWGYQNTGFFAPTSRYGTAAGLMELIDKLHNANIGTILDFVPVHFAIDSYGLAMYDGTALYEYPHSDVSVSEWGSYNFIYSRREVCCFLQSAANYWLKEYHFDGLRMDAISRGIYWQGDERRGVNPGGIDFFKNMNRGLKKLHPTAMLIAEDSTNYNKITAPVEYGGLGFDYKWNMGWMNDTLNYFKTPPAQRPMHYHKLTFSMHYFYNEIYLLPFSHDECVHGKATIIQKMWGGYEDKFPQCRGLYLYMLAHPGKKLNFMGNEIAQFREWDEKRQQDWDILEYPLHDAFHKYMIKLNGIYKEYPALHKGEYDPACFRWIVADGDADSVYIFMRGREKERLLAAFNFSAADIDSYTFRMPEKMSLKEIVSSDYEIYGGRSKKKTAKISTVYDRANKTHSMKLSLPAFSGRLFKEV